MVAYRYFRIPVDNYYEAVTKTKRPKYAGAFNSYSASYGDTICYVKAEVKDEYVLTLLIKDDVTEFTEEEYNNAVQRLRNKEV